MAENEANPQVRGSMERRWDDARKDCTAGTCPPSYRFHVKGCARRRAYVAGDRQAADATFRGDDAAVMAGVLSVPLEALMAVAEKELTAGVEKGMTVTYDTSPIDTRTLPAQQTGHVPDFEKELFEAMEDARQGKNAVQPIPLILTEVQVEQYAQSGLLVVPDEIVFPAPAPARPWWKFWGRRG